MSEINGIIGTRSDDMTVERTIKIRDINGRAKEKAIDEEIKNINKEHLQERIDTVKPDGEVENISVNQNVVSRRLCEL